MILADDSPIRIVLRTGDFVARRGRRALHDLPSIVLDVYPDVRTPGDGDVW